MIEVQGDRPLLARRRRCRSFQTPLYSMERRETRSWLKSAVIRCRPPLKTSQKHLRSLGQCLKTQKRGFFFAPAARQRLKRQPKSLSRAVPGGSTAISRFLGGSRGVYGGSTAISRFSSGGPQNFPRGVRIWIYIPDVRAKSNIKLLTIGNRCRLA